MGIKTKFYLYLLVTIALSPILASEMVLAYQSPNALDITLVLLILSVYLGLYLAIRNPPHWKPSTAFRQNLIQCTLLRNYLSIF